MNNKTTPKEFFFHLGATLALYIGVAALINLAFSIVDFIYPDVLAGYFDSSSIAWPISMLIVLVPVLYILEWLILRDIKRLPERAQIWVSRWRTYLTLFLAGAIIVGNLIALIFTYLNGEISTRFVLKVSIFLILSGAIFLYYLLRRITSRSSKIDRWQRILSIFGIVVVAGLIIGGFIIVGSPSTQRDNRMDSQRVQDLSNIQWQIVNYWQMKQVLPNSLVLLNDSISGYVTPVDPDTSLAYTYKVVGKSSFSLCATFARASLDTKGRPANLSIPTYPVPVVGTADTNSAAIGIIDVWSHGVGEVCFDRTIDPQKYPFLNKPNF